MVEVVEAATVLCLRRNPNPSQRTLRASDYSLTPEANKQLGNFAYQFGSGLQVLMGQSEVVNWVRSSPESLVIMRYAGEYKFAGGSKDEAETLTDTARRELSEEFTIEVPPSAVIHPFRVNSTRAIKGKSFLMYNFVCFEDENEWLAKLDTEDVNQQLAAKRNRFQELDLERFWNMDKEQREEVSPEVHRIDWLVSELPGKFVLIGKFVLQDLADAVEMCLTSKGRELTCVNEWQRENFAHHGITKRDPMYASMMTIQLVEQCGSIDGVRAAASEFSTKAAAEAAEESRTQVWKKRACL
jgi:8-oxo-dGTP pyrophosphatase MutT (NUDIX family)